MTILGHLKTLTHLDGVIVAEDEAAEAIKMVAASKINQVKTFNINVNSCSEKHFMFQNVL